MFAFFVWEKTRHYFNYVIYYQQEIFLFKEKIMEFKLFSNIFIKKREDYSWLFSMANRYKDDVDLPMNIWLDEAEEYKEGGHSKRIKFQMNHANRIQKENLASMTLDGKIVKETYKEKKSELDSKDIKEVSNFVKNNSYALDKLADQMIRCSDFDKIMIKGGKEASESEIARLKEDTDKYIKIRS